MLSRLLASIAGTLIAYSLFKILRLWYQELNSPLRHLPGPRSSSFIYGNGKELLRDNGPAVQEKWVQTYGRTLKYPFFFGLSRLYTTDTKALNHFLTNHDIYQRPSPSRYLLSLIVGPGVLVTEGEVHRRQNPAFGPLQIRELTSIFLEKSEELRNIWASQAASGAVRLDVLPWLNKTTLDIIGLAGFDYPFNSLGAERPTELAIAFAATVQASASLSALDMVLAFVPALRAMPTKFAAVCRTSQDTMNRIGRQILRNEMAESGTFETGGGRDLLSLLVRANTAKDISESQRLSEEEVLARICFSLPITGTTWALFALTQNILAQTRLRAELLSVQTDSPTMDELDTLPYLDCVVREALRVHPPVVSTGRVAMQDDVVPLDTPWTDKYGNVHKTLRWMKQTHRMIPIMMMNRDKEIWGPDAAEFIPERWESEPPISNTLPGVWGQVLTFLGGPRACIGYRFSVIQMKALLFTLVRAFEFELAVPAADIGRKISIVQRPMVRSEPGAGAQMPLLVKPYVRPT
ncbi:cytochrome P450 [Mycena olivaceomarginata]|nr:cytochrome P450 [Mycena olivaceomarginata]